MQCFSVGASRKADLPSSRLFGPFLVSDNDHQSLQCATPNATEFYGPRADTGAARGWAVMSIDGTEINRKPNCLPAGLGRWEGGLCSLVDLCIE